MEHHFYIDLLSNTPNESFENTRSEFVTPLHDALIFDNPDDYEVGISEIAFSNSFTKYEGFRIKLSKTYLDPTDLMVKNREKSLRIDMSHLGNNFPLLEKLRSAIERFNLDTPSIARFKGRFRLIKKTHKLELSLYPGERLQFIPQKFAQLIGFDNFTFYGETLVPFDVAHGTGSHNPEYLIPNDAENSTTFEAIGNIDLLSEFYYIFIYTNLIRFTRVASDKAPLLRTIPVKGRYGDHISLVFNNIYYYSLASNFFSEIRIELRNDTGELISFDFGRTYVKLHFRKKTRTAWN